MHYHKIKMTAAAMAMAVLVTGNMPAAELNTATVSASLRYQQSCRQQALAWY